MKILKWIAIVVASLLGIIQFIRPEKNIADNNPTNDITRTFNVPPDVQEVLQTSCYDCHSNTTRYPWYAEIQPVAWWLNDHIKGGKRELNFSEFSGYRIRRQYIKLEQIIDLVTREEMPLPSYLLIHTDARLSAEQKERLVAWANVVRDSIKSVYPADSLARRR